MQASVMSLNCKDQSIYEIIRKKKHNEQFRTSVICNSSVFIFFLLWESQCIQNQLAVCPKRSSDMVSVDRHTVI